MIHQFKKLLIAASLLLASATYSRAELVVYDLGNAASRSLQVLGTAFITGCTILAIGAIVAAVISRKK